jgi:DNA polymerase-3 subunit delta'
MLALPDILNQDQAITALQAALRSGRLHHAYIFHGPPGVGKCTTARALGQVILCLDPQTDLVGRIEACGACQSCQLMAAGTHPDFRVITKELALYNQDRGVRGRKLLNIPVAVIRDELLDKAYLAPQVGQRKVLVVDEAELLEPVGQNAMLKTLEEPPAGTHLILVTANENDLLPTVRSRCHRVGFAPLPDALIEQRLAKLKADLSPALKRWLVRFAAGSLGRLELAIEYDLSNWATPLLEAFDEMQRGRYPAGLAGQLSELLDGFATRWVKEHDNASKDSANRQAAGLLWTMIGQEARMRMTDLAARCPAGDPENGARVLGPWLGVLDAARQAEVDLGSNINMGLVTDHLVSQMWRALAGSSDAAAAPR